MNYDIIICIHKVNFITYKGSKEHNMMNWKFESNDYHDVKKKFEEKAMNGYNHIFFWIISVEFYHKYLSDNIKMKGRRILVNNEKNCLPYYNFEKVRFAGYNILTSDKFECVFGIYCVTFSGLNEVDRSNWGSKIT